MSVKIFKYIKRQKIKRTLYLSPLSVHTILCHKTKSYLTLKLLQGLALSLRVKVVQGERLSKLSKASSTFFTSELYGGKKRGTLSFVLAYGINGETTQVITESTDG